MKTANRERWLALWEEVAATGKRAASYEELEALYSQPHRHYHNFRHIADCLVEFDAARHLARHPLAVELSVWFHDAVYDTHAQDNEEKSSELARFKITEAGGPPELCRAVTALIMATKSHDPSLHPDASLLVDVDLSIFGRSGKRFEEYEAQIRSEYEWVPWTIFASKRAEILERFLARDRIFSTGEFFAKYEDQARRNLRSSILKLKKGL